MDYEKMYDFILGKNNINWATLIDSCKPSKKRGRPSHKRQLQEIRNERKINLQTPESVLTVINLRSILTLDTLRTLPLPCQNQLIRLLPEFDQILQPDESLRASPTALSNEYFASFCNEFVEKLSDNKLSEKAMEQAKTDTSRELAKLDPWKLRNYEPIWGKKLLSQRLDHSDDDDRLEKVLKTISRTSILTQRTRDRLRRSKRKAIAK